MCRPPTPRLISARNCHRDNLRRKATFAGTSQLKLSRVCGPLCGHVCPRVRLALAGWADNRGFRSSAPHRAGRRRVPESVGLASLTRSSSAWVVELSSERMRSNARRRARRSRELKREPRSARPEAFVSPSVSIRGTIRASAASTQFQVPGRCISGSPWMEEPPGFARQVRLRSGSQRKEGA